MFYFYYYTSISNGLPPGSVVFGERTLFILSTSSLVNILRNYHWVTLKLYYAIRHNQNRHENNISQKKKKRKFQY